MVSVGMEAEGGHDKFTIQKQTCIRSLGTIVILSWKKTTLTCDRIKQNKKYLAA